MTTEARGTDSAVADVTAVATEIGEKIAEMRGVMIRIVSTSSDGPSQPNESQPGEKLAA